MWLEVVEKEVAAEELGPSGAVMEVVEEKEDSMEQSEGQVG